MGERAEKLDAADVIARQSAEIATLQSAARDHEIAAEEYAATRAEIAALKAENERLRTALRCADIGMCSVAVPHEGERALLQRTVNAVRAALAGDPNEFLCEPTGWGREE